MIIGALEIGVPLSTFWRLTPRSLSWHHRAARARSEEEMARIYAAESLSRARKLPGLDKWLGRKAKADAHKGGKVEYLPGGAVRLGGPRDFMRHLAGRAPAPVKEAANG